MNIIEYDVQLKKFHRITQVVDISPQAIALYFQLINCFYNKGMPLRLKIDNNQLYHLTKLSRQALHLARIELVKLTLIDYTPGSGSASGEYMLLDLSEKRLEEINKDLKFWQLSDAKIANVNNILKEFEYRPKEYQFYAQYVIKILQDAIKNKQTGIFNNSYETAQTFLAARNNITVPIISRVITSLMHKPDIQNKPAYVLTVIADQLRKHQITLKQGGQNE